MPQPLSPNTLEPTRCNYGRLCAESPRAATRGARRERRFKNKTRSWNAAKRLNAHLQRWLNSISSRTPQSFYSWWAWPRGTNLNRFSTQDRLQRLVYNTVSCTACVYVASPSPPSACTHERSGRHFTDTNSGYLGCRGEFGRMTFGWEITRLTILIYSNVAILI